MSRAQLAQPRTRGPWWTTHTAALCPALAVLLGALVLCLGYATHGSNGDRAAAMTGISGVQVPTGDMTDHHAVPAAHSGDRPAVHDVRVILAAPSHHPAVFLPRLPDLPRPVGTPAFLAHAPPTGAGPDLHVLQVQRTWTDASTPCAHASGRAEEHVNSPHPPPYGGRKDAHAMSKTSKKAAALSRKARIEEMRRAERARERRNRVITITLSTVIVAGLVGWGAYALNSANEKKEQQAAAAKAPVSGEKTWDKKKLTQNHVQGAVKYPMNPPVGGDHHQAWMTCDGTVYTKAIANENAVHSLEHGAVWITYNDKATEADIKKLGDKVSKTPYTLMSPAEDQSGTIMLSAWGRQLTVDNASEPRVEQFLTKYVQGAQTPEPGAACTGGLTAA